MLKLGKLVFTKLVLTVKTDDSAILKYITHFLLSLDKWWILELKHFKKTHTHVSHNGPDHVQLTLLNWDNESVLAVNEKLKFPIHFQFLFRAKTLLVSQLSKVHCRWSGPICLAKKNAQCLLSIPLTLQQSIKGKMPLSNVEV